MEVPFSGAGAWRSIAEDPRSAAVGWRTLVEEDPSPAPPAAAPAARPPRGLERLAARTPWWALSVGLHVALLLLLGFFWAAGAALEEEPLRVAPPRPLRPLPEMGPPPEREPERKILDVRETAVVDPVYRKDADEAERHETADEEEFRRMKGESFDFVSERPFRGRATSDVAGGAAAAGGRFGSRLGGKGQLVARGGGGAETEGAVMAALKWLARHQASDGSWPVRGQGRACGRFEAYPGRCQPDPGRDEYAPGVTGLALLAFLGAGYSHLSRETHEGICFGDVVRRGLRWLVAAQDRDGRVGPRRGNYLYNHSIAALALTEAYGLTGSHLLEEPAARALDFLLAAQNPGRAWRYTFRSGDNDTSVTGWAVMALKSAELSGLPLDPRGYAGTRAWLDAVTDPATGAVGYVGRRDFENRRAMTGVGVMARIFIDRDRSDPRVRNGADFLLGQRPAWPPRGRPDFYCWYYASLALFQFDGPSGPKWRAWNAPMKSALVGSQNRGRECRSGSWEPADRWSGAGGRVYATAVNALTLEVYYRYAHVFGVK